MIKFGGYYRNGAVIQRNKPIIVNGYASEAVRCILKGGKYREEKEAITNNGKFIVEFSSVTDTESDFILTAESDGGETITIEVRFGDVYLALGQSNMSYCISAMEDGEKWLKRANKANISILNLEEKPLKDGEEMTRSVYPREDFIMDYDWQKGTDENLKSVSALSVEIAVILFEKYKIPIGIVHTAMGGLSVESYMSREICEKDKELLDYNKRVGRYVSIEEYNNVGGRNYTQTAGVWNEKIAPLLTQKFSGIVWYLGESSAMDFELGKYFLRSMELLVDDYNNRFDKIPFIATHIAPEYYPYGDNYGYLYINEALTLLQKSYSNVVSVPIYDIEPRWQKGNGDLYFHPIHTINKSLVAKRIAEALDDTRTRFPEITAVNYLDGKAICEISNIGQGLNKGNYNGFTIAGDNGKYYPAKAELNGKNKIVVSSLDVEKPSKITYAFMQYQDFCNVKTVDGEAMLPYRTDKEKVNDNYYFAPAFTVNGKEKVYENNFGCQVGTCRKVKIWSDGELYDGAFTKITSDGESMVFTAKPTAKNYFLFGISPTVCLTGHKHHLDGFKYLNFDMRADKNVEFLGLVFRIYDGSVYRFDLKNGEKNENSILVEEKYTTFTVGLESGMGGDSSAITLSNTTRKTIVQAEFLFRAKEKVTLHIKNIVLSDINNSSSVKISTENIDNRNDIKLPEKNNS